MSIAESIWYGRGAAASIARFALTPLSWAYAAGARAHGWNRARRRTDAALPCLSIGNLSVGGTGKTPMAAWAAAALRAKGAHPAIIMRGYGDDEPLVHRMLNVDVPVIVGADRAQAVMNARDGGADCAILDDAFQYRQISRIADWILVAAEQWRSDSRVLPAGPLRESSSALRRGNVVIVTRKSSSDEIARAVADELGQDLDPAMIARCRFDLGVLRSMSDDTERTLESLRGLRVLAIAAVGDPRAFFSQLAATGANVHEVAFADHHAFSPADVARLKREAGRADVAVCTLKDAVKLSSLWTPIAMPLWYVSQEIVIESGAQLLDHWLEAVLAARQPTHQPNE